MLALLVAEIGGIPTHMNTVAERVKFLGTLHCEFTPTVGRWCPTVGISHGASTPPPDPAAVAPSSTHARPRAASVSVPANHVCLDPLVFDGGFWDWSHL